MILGLRIAATVIVGGIIIISDVAITSIAKARGQRPMRLLSFLETLLAMAVVLTAIWLR